MTQQRYTRNRYALPLDDVLGRHDYEQSAHQQGRQFVLRLQRRRRRLPDLCHIDLGFTGVRVWQLAAAPLLQALREPAVIVEAWWYRQYCDVELPAADD